MIYPFQEQVIKEVFASYRRGNRHILVQAPTGSGKSHIIKYLADNAKTRCEVITHRKELKKMLENKVNVRVHMVETFKRRDLEYPDLMLIDEAHLSLFDKVIDNAPDSCNIIGFTATPLRTGKQRPLGDFYQDMVKAPSTERLIEMGFLVPTINYGYEAIDWSKAKKTAGDYDLGYQSEMFEKRRVYEGVAKNYLRITPNTKAMVFTPDIESSRKLARHLQNQGLPARCVDSQMQKTLIEENTEWFKQSKNGILVNCSLLTTGFDCPDVETIILYRATISRALYNQMIGRGTRTHSGKTHCTVLDFGENIKRFGFWEDDYDWSLYKRAKTKNALPPVRLCPKCDRMSKLQDKACRHCGFLFPVKVIHSEEAELSLIAKKPKIGYYLHQAKSVEEAKQIIKDYGYKPGWWFMNKHRFPHLTK